MDCGSAALTHSADQESLQASASEGGRFQERSAAKSEKLGANHSKRLISSLRPCLANPWNDPLLGRLPSRRWFVQEREQ